jgi:hypothetical protein
VPLTYINQPGLTSLDVATLAGPITNIATMEMKATNFISIPISDFFYQCSLLLFLIKQLKQGIDNHHKTDWE